METASRRTIDPVIDALAASPQRFEFFQAVRLLRRAYSQHTQGHPEAPRAEGFVRFGAESSLAFSGAQITQVEIRREQPREPDSPVTTVLIRVSFFGLVGFSGVLPFHYTVDTIRLLRERESALLDFFDVFHSRLLHYFYLAWEKHQVGIQYEEAREAGSPQIDRFSHMLQSLMGLSTYGQENRSSVSTDSHLRYAAFFAQHRRNATSLRQMLSEYFGVNSEVRQFQFLQLAIPEEDRSQLPLSLELRNFNNQVGVNVVLGRCVWDCVGKFVVRFGPLDFDRYVQFIREGEDYQRASYLIRLYVRSEFVFEIQPILKRDQVPTWELRSGRNTVHRLGRTVWLKSKQPKSDFEGAIYASADASIY